MSLTTTKWEGDGTMNAGKEIWYRRISSREDYYLLNLCNLEDQSEVGHLGQVFSV